MFLSAFSCNAPVCVCFSGRAFALQEAEATLSVEIVSMKQVFDQLLKSYERGLLQSSDSSSSSGLGQSTRSASSWLRHGTIGRCGSSFYWS